MNSKNRRSSILKPTKLRHPLSDLSGKKDDDIKKTDVQSKRVSFASNNSVKPFTVDPDKATIWDSTYEESIETLQGSVETNNQTDTKGSHQNITFSDSKSTTNNVHNPHCPLDRVVQFAPDTRSASESSIFQNENIIVASKKPQFVAMQKSMSETNVPQTVTSTRMDIFQSRVQCVIGDENKPPIIKPTLASKLDVLLNRNKTIHFNETIDCMQITEANWNAKFIADGDDDMEITDSSIISNIQILENKTRLGGEDMEMTRGNVAPERRTTVHFNQLSSTANMEMTEVLPTVANYPYDQEVPPSIQIASTIVDTNKPPSIHLDPDPPNHALQNDLPGPGRESIATTDSLDLTYADVSVIMSPTKPDGGSENMEMTPKTCSVDVEEKRWESVHYNPLSNTANMELTEVVLPRFTKTGIEDPQICDEVQKRRETVHYNQLSNTANMEITEVVLPRSRKMAIKHPGVEAVHYDQLSNAANMEITEVVTPRSTKPKIDCLDEVENRRGTVHYNPLSSTANMEMTEVLPSRSIKLEAGKNDKKNRRKTVHVHHLSETENMEITEVCTPGKYQTSPSISEQMDLQTPTSCRGVDNQRKTFSMELTEIFSPAKCFGNMEDHTKTSGAVFSPKNYEQTEDTDLKLIKSSGDVENHEKTAEAVFSPRNYKETDPKLTTRSGEVENQRKTSGAVFSPKNYEQTEDTDVENHEKTAEAVFSPRNYEETDPKLTTRSGEVENQRKTSGAVFAPTNYEQTGLEQTKSSGVVSNQSKTAGEILSPVKDCKSLRFQNLASITTMEITEGISPMKSVGSIIVEPTICPDFHPSSIINISDTLVKSQISAGDLESTQALINAKTSLPGDVWPPNESTSFESTTDVSSAKRKAQTTAPSNCKRVSTRKSILETSLQLISDDDDVHEEEDVVGESMQTLYDVIDVAAENLQTRCCSSNEISLQESICLNKTFEAKLDWKLRQLEQLNATTTNHETPVEVDARKPSASLESMIYEKSKRGNVLWKANLGCPDLWTFKFLSNTFIMLVFFDKDTKGQRPHRTIRKYDFMFNPLDGEKLPKQYIHFLLMHRTLVYKNLFNLLYRTTKDLFTLLEFVSSEVRSMESILKDFNSIRRYGVGYEDKWTAFVVVASFPLKLSLRIKINFTNIFDIKEEDIVFENINPYNAPHCLLGLKNLIKSTKKDEKFLFSFVKNVYDYVHCLETSETDK